MTYLISAITGYLIGSINLAYILGKLNGFDIREKGTGNAGASNIKIMLGWPAFFTVAVFDAIKAIIAMAISSYLLKSPYEATILSGCAAMIGHCLPIFMNFRGGKGFASYIGLAIGITPLPGLILVVAAVLAAVKLNYIVVATMSVVILYPIIYFFIKGNLLAASFLTLSSLFIIYKHRPNFKKLKSGEEFGINGKKIGIDNLKGKK